MQNEQVKTEKLGSQTVITLPKRDVSSISKYGWIGIAIGGFTIIFMCGWIGGPLYMSWEMIKNGQTIMAVALMLFAMLGLPGIYFGFKALAVGIGVLTNDTWTTITIAPNRFVICEHFWKFRWARKFKELPSNQLILDHLKSKSTDLPIAGLSELMMLGAKKSDQTKLLDEKPNATNEKSQKPIPLIVGYTQSILDDVIAILHDEVGHGNLSIDVAANRPADLTKSSPSSKQITVEEFPDDEDDQNDTPIEKPFDTIIEVEEHQHATVYRVPPVGVLKVGMFFWFAVIWLAFCLVFFSFAFSAVIWNGGGNGGAAQNKFPLFVLIPFALVFIGVGVGLLAGAINMGRRSCIIGVADKLIWIERISIFGKQTMQFEASSISSISMGPSGTEINEVPVMELQIRHGTDETHRLLSQLSESEILWIADTLRRHLGINKKSQDTNWANLEDLALIDNDSIPNAWRLNVNESANSLYIDVKADSVFRLILPLLFCAVFVCAGCGLIVSAFLDKQWITIPFGLIFAGVGFGISAIIITYSRRRFQFHVNLKSIVATRIRITGTDRFEFEHHTIDKIHPGDGSYKVNNQPQPIVEFLQTDKTREAFMFGRKPDAVLFVIAKLTAFLDANQLTSEVTATTESGDAIKEGF